MTPTSTVELNVLACQNIGRTVGPRAQATIARYVIAGKRNLEDVGKSAKTAPSKFALPTRRAVASLALVTAISAIENQRKAKKTPGEDDFAAQDMSGELQTIPARHGVATFVPRGRTIKIINTYGKQVVSTWAFSLHAPPEQGEGGDDEGEVEDVEEKVGELKKGLEEEEGSEKVEKVDKEVEQDLEKPKEEAEKAEKVEGEQDEASKDKSENASKEADASKDSDDPPEQAPDTPNNEKATSENQPTADQKTGKRTWASYLPSIPYRNKNAANKTEAASKADAETEKKQNEATSKAWSSYLPTGKGFSSYVPNVQLPDSQGVISAFKASHYTDPNKSYAEQLYDFSKTPVGAGGIAVATGSGTASSLYAAYSAYSKANPSKNDLPPMEYLSLPHCRAATHRLVPDVDDTLLTNLRNPIMTLIEDTTPGSHDTLTAACDASQYAALGVDKPEEHGSCAENLVLALKELNEKAGLKGTKAVGADITVNIAPTPLHLFMNAPIKVDSSAESEGSGAKGATLKVEEPKGKKRSFVRFKAERDIVVVLSTCPMDVGSQNGGKCMAANFMVEDAEEDLSASTSSAKKAPKKLNQKPKQADQAKSGSADKKSDEAKKAPRKLSQKPKEGQEDKKTEEPKPMPKPRGGPGKLAAVQKSAQTAADSGSDDPPESELPAEDPKEQAKAEPKQKPKQVESKAEDAKPEESPKPKKKPRKLERKPATPKNESS